MCMRVYEIFLLQIKKTTVWSVWRYASAVHSEAKVDSPKVRFQDIQAAFFSSEKHTDRRSENICWRSEKICFSCSCYNRRNLKLVTWLLLQASLPELNGHSPKGGWESKKLCDIFQTYLPTARNCCGTCTVSLYIYKYRQMQYILYNIIPWH